MPVPLPRLPAALLAAWCVMAPSLADGADPKGPQVPVDGKIYSCIDSTGRRLSSDRPIPECVAQEQRLLRRDGSQRGVVPPLMSPEEQERQEVRAKQRAQEQAVQNEAVRRDRNLLLRYPDLAAHELGRQRALAPVQKLIDTAKARLLQLEAEGLALTNERAALGFKAVPEELRLRTDSNEGALEAQRNILRNQEIERDRVHQQFDIERQRLQLLLGGLAPGSPDEPAGARRPAAAPPGGSAPVSPPATSPAAAPR